MSVVLLAVLLIDAAVLGAVELMFEPMYVGAVPVPIGALAAALTLPWLVRQAAEVNPAPAVAGAPVLVWLLVVGILGLDGPGGDVLLPATWQSVLLVVAGLGAGLLSLRLRRP